MKHLFALECWAPSGQGLLMKMACILCFWLSFGALKAGEAKPAESPMPKADDDTVPVNNAPQAALGAMPKGAISLQTKTFALPSGEVLLHLYTVPAGHSPEVEYTIGAKRTGPVLREHISTGPSLLQSRFWLDVFSKNGAQLRKLNSVPFIENKDAVEIKLRWLQPAKKQGPVILMHFGFTHWHEWVLIAFPQGFSGASTVQEFFWGGEGEIYNTLRFDKTDNYGRMIINEEEGDEKGIRHRTYRWDGVEFAQPDLPYFVIGQTPKTKAEAEMWIGKNKVGSVRPSGHYKNLKPGYYIVLLNRFDTLKEANAFAAGCRKEKIDCYVKRAF